MTKIAIDDGRPVGYYTTEQVCDITGVKPVTLGQWVRRGKIEALKITNGELTLLFFHQHQVDRILAHIKAKECLL